jgi:hypothetical protein
MRKPPKPVEYHNSSPRQNRVLIGTPTLGMVRMEWHNALASLVIPCNWSMSSTTPIGYLVADGQNLIAHEALDKGFEWVLFLEDDTVPPVDLYLRLAEYIDKKDAPVVSGLYHVKGGSEPMVYRGRGNGSFRDWKMGDKVWADGVPTGCLLVHTSILAEMAKASPNYFVTSAGNAFSVRKVFESPRQAWMDPRSGGYQKLLGTSDLYFCDQVMERDIFTKAGWPKIAKREFPFLVDTRIRCGHIDRDSGKVW